MSLTLTDGGSTTVTFSDPTDGFAEVAAATKFWTRKPVRGSRYGIERHKAPAVAGKVVKRHEFDSRQIGPLIVWYIDTTEQAVWTAYKTDHDALMNKVLTVTIPNNDSYVACNVEHFDPVDGAPKASGAGLFRMKCEIIIQQDRNA